MMHVDDLLKIDHVIELFAQVYFFLWQPSSLWIH